MSSAIQTRGLRKVYPAVGPSRRGGGGPGGPRPFGPPPVGGGPPRPPGDLVALAGLDLDVAAGECFGLLGPNGAGKTTTIGILTTRVLPTAGEAHVAGADVVRDAVRARLRIGVVPQRPNPDRSLTVEENLLFHAAYYGLDAGTARRRAAALLEQFGVAEKRAAKVDALSGGQQQRLMIARALIHEPDVLFLDEPTVGLDPQARIALWDVLRDLRRDGRTVVLTTHYMEEADQLCDRLAIVDRGELLALDTPDALKARAPGGTLLELTLDGDASAAADRARGAPGVLRSEAAGALLRVYAEHGGSALPPLLDAAEASGRAVRDIRLVPPSLESLFVSLTGRALT
ncbi:multidrug ABC transporter ATP-binding protein [Gemmatimonadetes bacterium T265]|nr:multidrug ABC transporter ATP-binding protein [Gemmatimonadetes bacterium T265]